MGAQRGSSLRCAALFSSSTPAASKSHGGSNDTDAVSSGFRPRRRTPRTYRPLEARPKPKPRGPPNKSETLIHKAVEQEMGGQKPSSDLEEEFGLDAAEALRHTWRSQERGGPPDIEAQLRAVDYLTAAPGSTEDMVGERRGAMDTWTEEERKAFTESLDDLIEEERVRGTQAGPVMTTELMMIGSILIREPLVSGEKQLLGLTACKRFKGAVP